MFLQTKGWFVFMNVWWGEILDKHFHKLCHDIHIEPFELLFTFHYTLLTEVINKVSWTKVSTTISCLFNIAPFNVFKGKYFSFIFEGFGVKENNNKKKKYFMISTQRKLIHHDYPNIWALFVSLFIWIQVQVSTLFWKICKITSK